MAAYSLSWGAYKRPDAQVTPQTHSINPSVGGNHRKLPRWLQWVASSLRTTGCRWGSICKLCVEEMQREGPVLPGAREVSRLSASTRSVTCSICWGRWARQGPARGPRKGKARENDFFGLYWLTPVSFGYGPGLFPFASFASIFLKLVLSKNSWISVFQSGQ